MTRPYRCLILAILTLCIFPICASAQTASASLSGRVTDQSGAVIPGASVKATNVLTGVTTATRSNGAGDYVFAALPPGTYRLTVNAPGFSQSVTVGIRLFVQDRIARNVALRVGASDQTVTVNASAQQLDTQDATVGTVVERGYIANMPLNGRSFQGLISMAPGVGTVAPSTSSGGQFVVNGQRTDTSYFTVDGVSANVAASGSGSLGTSGPGGQPTGSATGGYNNMVSLDDLEEFRISTSSFAPEFGRTPGGQISLITRSGTNTFHGDAFDYFRNTVLDANDWFLNAAGKARGVVQQNDFGGVFGGPILRNKLFFFASYEGLRLGNPTPSLTQVPTQAARTLAAAQPDGGDTGYMAQFLDAYPLPDGNPTTACTSSTTCIASYTSSFPTVSKVDTTSGRVDYTINPRMTLFGRYSHAPSSLVADSSIDANGVIDGDDTYTVGWTYAITNSISNDFHFNYSTTNFIINSLPFSSYKGSLTTIYPSGYAQPPSSYTTDQIGVQISSFAGGVTAFKLQPKDALSTSGQWNFTDALSVVKGPHQLKFGLDSRYLYPSNDQVNFNAAYQFATTNNCPGGTPAYICGLSNTANIQHNVLQAFRFREYSFYAQDTWKFNPSLTATYGLRWEVNMPAEYTSGYPLFSVNAASFNLNNMSQVTLNPVGSPAFSTDWRDISPRLGLAYELSTDPRWGRVLRAGYGIFYDTGNSVYGSIGSPFNARCNNLAACTSAPYTGPAVPSVQFPLTTANQRFAAPPVIPNPPVFPLALTLDQLVDPNFKTPYVHQTNLTLEQQLGTAQSLTLGYVGAFGRRLIGSYLYPSNLTNPNELGQGANCAAAPDCGDALYIVGGYAGSSYNGLQAKFQRQFHRGLGITASYTYSHSLDNASNTTTAGGFVVPTKEELAAGKPVSLIYGSSDFDMRHILALSLVSEIAGPKHGIGKALLSGWSFDPIYHYQTAVPANISVIATATMNGATSLHQFPNLIPGVPIYVSGSTCAAEYQAIDKINRCPGGRALNIAPVTAAVAASAGCSAPTATNAKGAFCTPLPVGSQAVSGDFGRNIVRSFPLQEFDLSAHRDFPLIEKVSLRFQADMFNVFNDPQFGPVDSLMLDSTFGTATSMANSALGSMNSSGSGFNSIFATGGPRNFQFAGKIIF